MNDTVVQDTNEQFDALLAGIKRAAPMLIDNIGITIKLRDMEAFPDWVAARDRRYGTTFLSRLWCRFMRPVVARKSHDEAVRDLDAAIKAHQVEFLRETMWLGEQLH